MEKSIKLILGILGCLSLLCLNSSFINIYVILGPIDGFVIQYIFVFISILAIFFMIYFAIILIIDTLKYIHKK